jgi:hypothetical protein
MSFQRQSHVLYYECYDVEGRAPPTPYKNYYSYFGVLVVHSRVPGVLRVEIQEVKKDNVQNARWSQDEKVIRSPRIKSFWVIAIHTGELCCSLSDSHKE